MVTRTKKVFVGGLSAPTTIEDIKNYFQQFGRVSGLGGGGAAAVVGSRCSSATYI